jgi:Flp pilus assembly protein TadD
MRTALWCAMVVMYVATFVRQTSGSDGGFDAMAPRPRALELAIGRQQFDEALPIALELGRMHPDNALVAYWTALVYQGLNRPSEEAAAWESYLTRSSVPQAACPAIADAYDRAGSAVASLGALERCARLDPAEPERHLDLGDGLARAGRFEEAHAAYRRGLAIDPDHPVLAARVGATDGAGEERGGEFPNGRDERHRREEPRQ